MQRRTLTAAAVVTTVALGVAACSASPEASEDGSGELVIAAMASAKPALDPIIERFEAEYPDIDVTATYADNQQYQAAIRTQLSSGTAPDVFTVWPGNGNPGAMEVLAPTGYLLDLGTLENLPAVPDALESVTEIDGTQYVFPMTVAGIGAIYNEQAVEEAGATVPTTWSEVLAFCEDATAAGKVGFALGLQSLWVTQLINYALVPTLVYSENPDFEADVAAGDATFADSGWAEAFDKYLEMDDAGCFSENPNGTSADIGNEALANGDALATVTLTTSVAAITSIAPEDTTFGMFALPATENPDDTWMPAAAFDGYGVNAKADNPVGAELFMEFLSSPESLASYATVAGSLPSIESDAYELTPQLTVLNDLWLAGKTYPFPDQLWPNPMVASAHKEGIQKIFGGQATPAEILEAMDAAYTAN